jgi:hypothetical protein
VAAASTISPGTEMKPSTPGRSTTSTPTRPMPMATQRRGPTRSPSSGTDSAAISSGATK